MGKVQMSLAFGNIISKRLWDYFSMGCPASQELSPLDKTHSPSQATPQKTVPCGSLPRLPLRPRSAHWVFCNRPVEPSLSCLHKEDQVLRDHKGARTAPQPPPHSQGDQNPMWSQEKCALHFLLPGFLPLPSLSNLRGLDPGLSEGLCVISNCTLF